MIKETILFASILLCFGCVEKDSDSSSDRTQKKQKESKLVVIQENIYSLDRSSDVFVIDKILSYYQYGSRDRYEFLVGDSSIGYTVDFCNVKETKVFFKDTIPCVKLFVWIDPEASISAVDSSKVELYLPLKATIRTVGGGTRPSRSGGAHVPRVK